MENQPFNIYEVSQEWAKQQNHLHLWAEKSTTSTNDQAKQELLPDGIDQGLYLTKHQTQGRGRGDHSWVDSGEGKYLLSTWVFRLHQSPQHITAPLFGLALFKAARTTWNTLPFSLKAPNDLLLGRKKVAGLLIESLNHGRDFFLMAGLGVNVFATPDKLTEATCLSGAEGVGDALSTNEWQDFLRYLDEEFSAACDRAIRHHLSEHGRLELLKALNTNPCLSSPILEVEANGDLITENGKISWYNI